jgi:hypothetical protein
MKFKGNFIQMLVILLTINLIFIDCIKKNLIGKSEKSEKKITTIDDSNSDNEDGKIILNLY